MLEPWRVRWQIYERGNKRLSWLLKVKLLGIQQNIEAFNFQLRKNSLRVISVEMWLNPSYAANDLCKIDCT